MVWNVDSHCFKGYCLSRNIFAKVQTQDLTTKKFKPKKSRPKKKKLADGKSSASPRSNKAIKSNCLDKKKEY